MKKIKVKFIDTKNRFLERFNENKFKTILEILIIVTYFAFALLLPTTSYTSLHLIPFFVAGGMVALVFLWIVLYGKIYLDYPTIIMFLFLVFNVLSWMINGFKTFNQTVVILPILFLFVYQYLKNTKTIKLFAHITYLGYLFFAIIFSIYYSNELIALNFERLGGAFGNVNGIGSFFATGFAFSLYYGIIKKRYHNLLFPVFLLFLSGTTGSKTAILMVAVSLIMVIIVKFGLKKWYITISIIVGFTILGVIILNIPAFYFLQDRITKMFQVFLGMEGSNVDGSTVTRLNMVYEGIYGFLQKPIFGWGHQGFRNDISSYRMYSHNNYIDLLSNYGLIGFLTFESIIFIPLFKYLSRKKTIGDKDNDEAKKLTSLMIILSVFLIVEQFTGVQSTTKEDYIFLVLISAISTEYYQKNHKTVVYIPFATRTLLSKTKFLKIEEPKICESELQIVSLKNLFVFLQQKFTSNKNNFLETIKSIKDPNNQILLFKEKSRREKPTQSETTFPVIATKQISKKEMVLNSVFVIFLSIQGTLAFSFSFYNSKTNLLNSAIEIANKQQINNSDPYVSFLDIDTNDNYSAALLKQNEEKKKFKTLNPYIKFDAHSFSYDGESFNLTGITAKDLTSNGLILEGIDLPIIFKEYSLEPLNGADYAIMITSKTALSLLGEESMDALSLIGKTFIDSNSKTYSINNIIYNEDVPIPKTTGINEYNDRLISLSKHLTMLNGDYVFYINVPIYSLTKFEYSLAYYPKGEELIDYINENYENYGVDKKDDNLLKFMVLDESGGYVLSEDYSNINVIYITYGQDFNQIYQILLTIISVVLYAISFAIVFDISKKYKNSGFLYGSLAISLLLNSIPLIFIRLFSSVLQIHVLANNATFIYLVVFFSSLLLLPLIQKITLLINIRKNRPK